MLRNESESLDIVNKPDAYRIFAYFDLLSIQIKKCSGSSDIGGTHLQISNPCRRQNIHQLSMDNHMIYNGNVKKWWKDFLSLSRPGHPQEKCWREVNSVHLCPGKRQSTLDVVLSLPVMLVLEVADDATWELDPALQQPIWNFPSELPLSTAAVSKRDGLIYDLVGIALISKGRTHFRAQFVSNGQTTVHAYDGMLHDGVTRLESPSATLKSHIAGKSPVLPSGYSVYSAIYHLRGGCEAQEKFFRSRSLLVKKQHKIDISTNTLSTLPSLSYIGEDLEELSIDRHWLPPTSATLRRTTEYVAPIALPASPIALPASPTALPASPTTLPASPTTLPGPTEPPASTTYSAFTNAFPVIPPLSNLSEPPLPPLDFAISSIASDQVSEEIFQCRCGLNGNPDLVHRAEFDGPTLRCDLCRNISHIACQRDGRASELRARDQFLCDHCSAHTMMHDIGRRSDRT